MPCYITVLYNNLKVHSRCHRLRGRLIGETPSRKLASEVIWYHQSARTGNMVTVTSPRSSFLHNAYVRKQFDPSRKVLKFLLKLVYRKRTPQSRTKLYAFCIVNSNICNKARATRFVVIWDLL